MKKLTLPLSKEKIGGLKAGDEVLISGKLYTARDAAHKKGLPISVKGQTVYYVGPTPARKGAVIGSAGPTTSLRMDKYTPALLKKGLAAMIGKGKRSLEVVNAIIQNRAVYFVTIGGAGAYLSKRIISSKIVAYKELGTEAVRQIEVKDFPAVVAIDSKGKMIDSMR
ncbi:MAG: fumarate hydratase C-terminal domain-containing protein [Candidatus Margulisiibacteriota bacterium]